MRGRAVRRAVPSLITDTEAGAKKMIAFWEAHAGQKVRTRVGDYFGAEGVCYQPQNAAEYAHWMEGWIKTKADKIVGVTADEAEAILAGLKEQPGK
jgi:hypothetical protein